MYCLDPVFYFVRCVVMSTYCVTKVEARDYIKTRVDNEFTEVKG